MKTDEAALRAEWTQILGNQQTLPLVGNNSSAPISPLLLAIPLKDAFCWQCEKAKHGDAIPKVTSNKHPHSPGANNPTNSATADSLYPHFVMNAIIWGKLFYSSNRLETGCFEFALQMQVICSKLLFRAKSQFLWPSTGRAGGGATLSLSQGLHALSQLNPIKVSILRSFSPPPSTLTQQRIKCSGCCRETRFSNAANLWWNITANICTTYNVSAWQFFLNSSYCFSNDNGQLRERYETESGIFS